MQQIADQVGVHVTTVSRAVDDKWVQTPRGIFPLKRFFGGGTQTATGEEVAWETIKQKLLEIIGDEDKSQPALRRGAGRRSCNEAGLPGRPADGDEVPQDAQHPVVAAAEGLDASRTSSRVTQKSRDSRPGEDQSAVDSSVAIARLRDSRCICMSTSCRSTSPPRKTASARAAARRPSTASTRRAGSPPASASPGSSTPTTSFFELGLWAAWDMYAEWGGAPSAGRRHRHRHGRRPAGHGHRQRRHREGRRVLPDDRARRSCAPSASPWRTACRSSTSSIPPASSCRCRTRSFPTRTTSAASSATTPSSPRPASRSSRPSWATASPAAATCRCCATSC